MDGDAEGKRETARDPPLAERGLLAAAEARAPPPDATTGVSTPARGAPSPPEAPASPGRLALKSAPSPTDDFGGLREIVMGADTYEWTSLKRTGSFGEVRSYVNLANGTAVVVKSFFGNTRQRVAQFRVERAAWREILRAGEPAISGVARVLGFAGTEKHPVVTMERLEATFSDEMHGGRMRAVHAYKEGVRLLDAVAVGRLAYLDATFANAGIRAGSAKLLDLGAFYVRDHGSQRLTPSYVPPFMWRTNRDTNECFCSTDGRMYSLPEMRSVGYYALLCSALGVYLGDLGMSVEDAFFAHTTHLAAWFAAHGFDAVDEAIARYKALLSNITAPEARPLLDAIAVFLSTEAEDDAMLNVARVAAKRVPPRPSVRKVAWKTRYPARPDSP